MTPIIQSLDAVENLRKTRSKILPEYWQRSMAGIRFNDELTLSDAIVNLALMQL